MSGSEEVKVGSFNKVPKRPMPNSTNTGPGPSATAANDKAGDKKAANGTPATEVSNADIGAKLDQVNKHLQAIDWKLWVYLKAHNYID